MKYCYLCWLLSTLSVIRHLSVATNRIGFWTWIWSMRHCGQGQEVVCWFQYWKNSTGFDWPLMLLMRKQLRLFLRKKSPFEILRNWIWALTLSLLLKLPLRKLNHVIYNQRYNNPCHEKLKSVQLKTTLVITGAISDTLRKKKLPRIRLGCFYIILQTSKSKFLLPWNACPNRR